METTLLLLLLLIVCLDVGAVRLSRRLLLDFLVGAHNRKSADRIHDAQPYDERLTLNYIGGHLKRYQREFRFWLRFYHALFWSLLPKYVLILTLAVAFWGGTPCLIAFGILAGLGLVLCAALRMQFDSLWVSRYGKK